MADTSFVDNDQTLANRIVAIWLNIVNKYVYWGRRPNYATTTGSANAQILTLETGSLYTAGSEADGDTFSFTAGYTNGSAMTLQVLPSGGSNTARAVQIAGIALVGGEIIAGRSYKVTRLGTTWQITSANLFNASGIFYAKAFGVVADGSTNDSTALQAAITAAAVLGGTVILPPGTIKIFTTTIVVPVNVSVIGQGPLVTEIYYTGSAVAVQGGDTAAAADTSTITKGRFADFSITGNGLSIAGSIGLALTNCRNAVVSNIWCRLVETGFSLAGTVGYCVLNEFYSIITSSVKFGLVLNGTSSTRGCNANAFFAPKLYGDATATAGGRGIRVVYGDTNQFFAPRAESFALGYSVETLSNYGHNFWGPRAESCTVDFTLAANTTKNVIFAPSATITDSGLTNAVYNISGNISHLQQAQGSNVTAANNLALGTTGNYFQVDGATQVNLLSSTNWQGGSVITLKFNSNPTVKHNQGVSGAFKPVLLAGAADFVASANDTLTLRYDGTDAVWYEQARAVI